jgi:hypothetical protein
MKLLAAYGARIGTAGALPGKMREDSCQQKCPLIRQVDAGLERKRYRRTPWDLKPAVIVWRRAQTFLQSGPREKSCGAPVRNQISMRVSKIAHPNDDEAKK